MRNQPKLEASNEFLDGFNDLQGLSGLEYVGKNLGSISVDQAQELVDSIQSMDRSPSDSDFGEINSKMGEVLNGLQEIIDGEVDPESMNEEVSGPELSVVENGDSSYEVESAQEKVDNIKDMFDAQRGFLDESTLAKVEEWQKEIDGLTKVLGSERVGSLYGQLEIFKIDVEAAQKARKVVVSQPSTRRPSGARPGGRVSRPSAPVQKKSLWSRMTGR